MVEALFAQKAFEHAELHVRSIHRIHMWQQFKKRNFQYNLLCSVNPRELKLTPYDDIIYKTFKEDFPDISVAFLDEEKDFKCNSAKERWRKFIAKFDKLEDFNFGTLLRTDAAKEGGPDNSIFVVRIQFLAVEIARNREGCNDVVRENHSKKADE